MTRALSQIAKEPSDFRRILDQVGLDGVVNTEGSPNQVWLRMLSTAQAEGLVGQLLEAAQAGNDPQPVLLEAMEADWSQDVFAETLGQHRT